MTLKSIMGVAAAVMLVACDRQEEPYLEAAYAGDHSVDLLHALKKFADRCEPDAQGNVYFMVQGLGEASFVDEGNMRSKFSYALVRKFHGRVTGELFPVSIADEPFLQARFTDDEAALVAVGERYNFVRVSSEDVARLDTAYTEYAARDVRHVHPVVVSEPQIER